MTVLVHESAALRATLDEARRAGKRIGFVPTMGALHDGHLALIDEAKKTSDFIVVSVFVNPLQFGPSEDFTRYPRTLDSDVAGCSTRGVDIVFAPDRETMYPDGFATSVVVSGVTDALEGAHRPGHFQGVTTVVAKLFALVGPCTAVFGRKDYQQWKVISRMTRDLGLPVEIVGMRTVRESTGLALSSRNRYLSAPDHMRAHGIIAGLRAAARAFDAGERDAKVLESIAREPIDLNFDQVDYVSVADAETLQPIVGKVANRAVLAVAAKIGTTRLIDNLVLGEESAP